MMTWMHQHKKAPQIDMAFRQGVTANIESIIKRAETMACKLERDQVRILSHHLLCINSHLGDPKALQQTNPQNINTTPIVQTVTNLISSATNPLNLTKMGETYVPWF